MACARIPEFESYDPSHAVVSSAVMTGVFHGHHAVDSRDHLAVVDPQLQAVAVQLYFVNPLVRARRRFSSFRKARSGAPFASSRSATTPSAGLLRPLVYVQRLHELGWVEGRTVAIEYRWAEGRNERYAEIAAEFVRLKVDVIVTVGSAVLAAKRATSTIPIVFGIAVDPVGSGMVASLARPGGNVTGLSIQATYLARSRGGIFRRPIRWRALY
jgi:hypothetical protein